MRTSDKSSKLIRQSNKLTDIFDVNQRSWALERINNYPKNVENEIFVNFCEKWVLYQWKKEREKELVKSLSTIKQHSDFEVFMKDILKKNFPTMLDLFDLLNEK